MTAYKNARGKWSIDIGDFYHADGHLEPRIRKTSPVNSKPGAERYERQVRQALQDGTYGKQEGDVPMLEDFVDEFIDAFKGDGNSDTGTYNNETLFRAHLVPLFGKRLITSFGYADEVKLKKRFKEGELSASRYNQATAAINGAIKLYYKVHKLKDPFVFKKLRISDVTKGFYEFDQYAALLRAAKGIGVISELVVLLGRDMGLRRSEMFGLAPRFVRMNEKKLIIERAEVLIGARRVMKPCKGKELRTLTMTPAVLDCFKRYFKLYGNRERIIAQSDGQPHTQKTFARLMSIIQSVAGLEADGEVHVLRHTCCSHMAILGVPVMVIQKYAGHQQLKTTLGYMHLAPGDDRLGTEALARPVTERGNATATALAPNHEVA
jgi:integrase